MKTSSIFRNITLSAFAVAVSMAYVPSAHAQAGQLDPSFGTNGIFGTTNDRTSANAMAIQSDGKILIAGFGVANSQTQDTMFRLTTSGTLDTTFGTGGFANIQPPNTEQLGFFGVNVLPGGKILAMAESYNGVLVARLLPNGSVDTTFGSGGYTTTVNVPNGFDVDFPSAMTVQPDGKIIVVGGFANPSVMARFNASGSLDSTFGTNGVANLLFPNPTQVAVQPSGNILVTSGQAGNLSPVPAPQAGTLVRYNSNGTVDTTFGSAGIVACLPSASGLLVHGDGAIVVAGSTTSNVNAPPSASDIGFGLAGFNGSGAIARGFGMNGAATTGFGSSVPQTGSFALALQSNGDIVAGGTAGATTSNLFFSSFALARYTSKGVLDTSFGTNGIVITTIEADQNTAITALAIESDQKIIAAGTASFSFDFQNAYVARYLSQ